MDYQTINILITIIMCLIGASGWLMNILNDTSSSAAQIKTLEVQVKFLQQSIDNLKKDFKSLYNIVKSAIDNSYLAETEVHILQEQLDNINNNLSK